MSLNYTQLSDALQNYLQNSGTQFVADIPVIVRQAEDRILKSVQLPDFRTSDNTALTASQRTYDLPADFLSPYSFSIAPPSPDDPVYTTLLQKDVSYMREFWPNATTEGTPLFYGFLTDTQFVLAPTPDAAYLVDLQYFFRPESIVTASTSWLGDNAENCLLYACLVEAYRYMKGEQDLIQYYEAQYQEAIRELRSLGEGFSTTDNYRSGAVEQPR